MDSASENWSETEHKRKDRGSYHEPSMIFSDAVRDALSQYGKFEGRSRRSEYWYFLLFVSLMFIAIFIFGWLTSFLDPYMIVVRNFLLAMTLVVSIVPLITVSVRRLHDVGMSGWILVPLALLTAGIGMMVIACMDSNEGVNRFGQNPKGLYRES